MIMKKKVRKISFFLCLLFVVMFCFNIGAFAIKTDGIMNEDAWNDASVFVLEEQKNFNNKIKSSVVKVVENKKDGYVYLAVMTEFEKGGSMSDGKVKIAVNNSDPAIISIGGGVVENGAYPIEAASKIDENLRCAFTEIEVFFKDGAKRSDIIKINLFDLDGTESGTYKIELEEEETTTTQKKTEKETTSKTTKTTTTKTTTSKTTTTKTSKSTTSKETTSKTTKTKTSRTTTSKTSKSTTSKATTSKTSKTEVTKKSKNETTEKSSKKSKATTKDDFTFKKVIKSTTEEVEEYSEEIAELIEKASYKETSVKENTSAKTEDSAVAQVVVDDDTITVNKKYLYLVAGAVCAAGIAVAAVAVASKSNKNDE